MATAMQHAAGKYVAILGLWQRVLGSMLGILCAGCYSPGPIGSASRPNVIVLRGTAGYFPNLAEFEDRLLDEGVCPTVAYAEAYPAIAERLVGGRNRGRLDGPVVIVGYSAGANAAISMSRQLGKRGIDVDKLVLLEATSGEKVPANVHSCFNIYKTQPWYSVVPAFGGLPVSSESSATALENYNVREYNDGRFDWENHLTLAANPDIQELMLEEVLVAFDAASSDATSEIPSDIMPGENTDGENADEGKMSLTDEPAPLAKQPELISAPTK